MSDQLTVSTSLLNQKVKFKASSRDNPEIILDYTPPIGDGEGYTSLELMLISLASCCGTSLTLMLRKMRKDVSGLTINAKGDRREQHPTYFSRIHLEMRLVSADAEDADMERALKLSEESICPVWNMLKNAVEISHEYTITRS